MRLTARRLLFASLVACLLAGCVALCPRPAETAKPRPFVIPIPPNDVVLMLGEERLLVQFMGDPYLVHAEPFTAVPPEVTEAREPILRLIEGMYLNRAPEGYTREEISETRGVPFRPDIERRRLRRYAGEKFVGFAEGLESHGGFAEVEPGWFREPGLVAIHVTARWLGPAGFHDPQGELADFAVAFLVFETSAIEAPASPPAEEMKGGHGGLLQGSRESSGLASLR